MKKVTAFIIGLVAVLAAAFMVPSVSQADTGVQAGFVDYCTNVFGGQIAKFDRSDNYVISGPGASGILTHTFTSSVIPDSGGLWLQDATIRTKADFRVPIYRTWVKYGTVDDDSVGNGAYGRDVHVLSAAPVEKSIKLLWVCVAPKPET